MVRERIVAMTVGTDDSSGAHAIKSGRTTGHSELGLRLARASVLSFFIYVGGAGLTGLAQLAIARAIGPSSYGIYSYVLDWTTFLSYGATLGFQTVLLRFVPAYSATGEWRLAHGVLRFAFTRALLLALAIAASGVIIVLCMARSLDPELAISMCAGLAAVPLTTSYLLGSAAVRSFGGVASAVAPERLGRDGLMIVLVVLAWLLLTGSIDAATVMVALFLSSAATASITWFNLRRLRPLAITTAAPSYDAPRWWHLALPVMIMIAVEVPMNRAGVIIFGWMGHAKDAGIFALGLNLALFLILPRVAVGTFFAPNVSKLHAQRDQTALQGLFARATLLSLAGTLTLSIPLLGLTIPILRLFGEEFVATAPIIQILVVGQIFGAASGPQLNLMTMTGHERAAAIIMLSGAAMNIASCAIGIVFFGVFGAAVATAATNVIWNVAMAASIYRRLDVVPGLLYAIVELRGRSNRV